MKIGIFGAGYVGLVTGACFAKMGNHVTCVDVDPAKIEKLNRGESVIYEPGLSDILKNALATKHLKFTTDAQQAIRENDILFIAVGTPPDEDGSADLQYVLAVAKTIGQHMQDYKIIVNKSTVPVGTADKVVFVITQEIKTRHKEIKFDVVSNPEFLKEGSAIVDCMSPDRIIIGSQSELAIKRMRQLYAPFSRNHDKYMMMNTRSAELTKYAANAMLATKISFMNEMSQIAQKVGADIESVRLGIGADHRIGYQFIYPGCGYGGSCFPKDVKALQNIAKSEGYHARLITAVEDVNADQKHVLFQMIQQRFKGDLKGKTFAIWGIAFKPNTDDIREAPSRVLIEALWAAGAKIRCYDPEAMDNFQQTYPDQQDSYQLTDTPEDALKSADALVVLTEWMIFRSPDFSQIKTLLKQPLIFDGRNIYDVQILKGLGIEYHSIGR